MTPNLIDTDNPEFQNALKLIQYPPVGLPDRKSGHG